MFSLLCYAAPLPTVLSPEADRDFPGSFFSIAQKCEFFNGGSEEKAISDYPVLQKSCPGSVPLHGQITNFAKRSGQKEGVKRERAAFAALLYMIRMHHFNRSILFGIFLFIRLLTFIRARIRANTFHIKIIVHATERYCVFSILNVIR